MANFTLFKVLTNPKFIYATLMIKNELNFVYLVLHPKSRMQNNRKKNLVHFIEQGTMLTISITYFNIYMEVI
jgi:hypothetical protein